MVTPPPLDLHRLRESWFLELRAARRSPATVRAYRISTTMFLDSYAELTKATVLAWLASLVDAEPATARLRLAAIKQFAKWLARRGLPGRRLDPADPSAQAGPEAGRGAVRRRAAPTDQSLRGHRRGKTSAIRRWCC